MFQSGGEPDRVAAMSWGRSPFRRGGSIRLGFALAVALAVSAGPASARPIEQEHTVGLGFHGFLLLTESSDRYLIQGPAVVYSYSVARRWGFATRLAAFFPLLGSM